jgi:uncharacterized protein (DUF111 family)
MKGSVVQIKPDYEDVREIAEKTGRPSASFQKLLKPKLGSCYWEIG